MSNTPLKLLLKARKRISNPRNWFYDSGDCEAKDEAGDKVMPWDKSACKFTANGVLWSLVGQESAAICGALFYLHDNFPGKFAGPENEYYFSKTDLTHSEVLKVFDLSIKAAKNHLAPWYDMHIDA